jgi:di/tricarboxylate transporter
MWLAVNFASAATGIGSAVALLFMPFTKLPPMVFIIVVMIIALVASNFLNNMMVAVVCLPFMINFTSLIGMEPMAAVVMMFIITEFALCTPAASPITALSMGQELADTAEVMKASLPMVAILFVVFLVFSWPLANFIF